MDDLTPGREFGYLCALMSAPSSRDPGARINPWRAVAAEQGFTGEAFPQDLPRLTEVLAGAGGTAEWPARFVLRFGRDAEGRALVVGRAALTLSLICQRCLGEVRIPLDAPLALGLITSEVQADGLPGDLDPVLVDENGIRPLDLVEEELLLAIPQFPLHHESACKALATLPRGDADQTPRGGNPFAVLVGLQGPARDSGEGGQGRS